MLGCQYNVVVADILTQCKVTFGLCKSAAARSIYSTSILWLHTIRQRRPISSAHFLCNVDFDIVRCGLIIGWQYLLSKILTYYLRISAEYLYISNNIKGANRYSRSPRHVSAMLPRCLQYWGTRWVCGVWPLAMTNDDTRGRYRPPLRQGHGDIATDTYIWHYFYLLSKGKGK